MARAMPPVGAFRFAAMSVRPPVPPALALNGIASKPHLQDQHNSDTRLPPLIMAHRSSYRAGTPFATMPWCHPRTDAARLNWGNRARAQVLNVAATASADERGYCCGRFPCVLWARLRIRGDIPLDVACTALCLRMPGVRQGRIAAECLRGVRPTGAHASPTSRALLLQKEFERAGY
jgi:hypothetical protein